MKYCIDCQYHEPSVFNTERDNFDKCTRSKKISEITGLREKYAKYQFCDINREGRWPWPWLLGTCGRAGRWWKRKD